jgi:hypothetical protein
MRAKADRRRGVTATATAADRKREKDYAQRRAEDDEDRRLAEQQTPEEIAEAIAKSRATRAKQPKRRAESL